MCISNVYLTLCVSWCHLNNLKNQKNTHEGVLVLVATLLKVTLLHGCFSRFLSCTNSAKPHVFPEKSKSLWHVLAWCDRQIYNPGAC